MDEAQHPPERRLTLRVDATLLHQLDALVGRLVVSAPGIQITRTDVVRTLLRRGLKTEPELATALRELTATD